MHLPPVLALALPPPKRTLSHMHAHTPHTPTVPQELAAMGRFTLRDEGRTIAIGKVTKLPKNH